MTLHKQMTSEPTVAIVGGGMGGLLTAYFLQHVYRLPADVTIFEAGDRTGGKVISRKFDVTDAAYEAGRRSCTTIPSSAPTRSAS